MLTDKKVKHIKILMESGYNLNDAYKLVMGLSFIGANFGLSCFLLMSKDRSIKAIDSRLRVYR